VPLEHGSDELWLWQHSMTLTSSQCIDSLVTDQDSYIGLTPTYPRRIYGSNLDRYKDRAYV